jgi:hypothetical protein
MSKSRILYYIRIVLTILVSITPLVITCWWLLDTYGGQINWKPVIAGLIITIIIIVVSAGAVFACMGTGILYQEIKIDLKDKKLKKEGFTVCRRCGGDGCRDCNNKGYLDWVQRVVGASKSENYDPA